MHQHFRHRADVRQNECLGEFSMHVGQFFHAKAGERRELELQKFIDIEAAVKVILIKFVVFHAHKFGIDHAFLHQVLRPGVVGIGVDQRVVEIENGEVGHSASCCFKSWRSKGSVMRLPIIME